MKLLSGLMLLCTPAIAADYVYVYYPSGNVGYVCNSLPSYLTMEGNSRLDFNKCDVQFTDGIVRPVFTFLHVRLTLSGPAFRMPNIRDCSFVAQATAVVDTSTVVDCR